MAAVRYREAFLAARDELLAELDGWIPSLKTPEAADRADRLPGKTARLVRAWPFRDVIAALDFVPGDLRGAERRSGLGGLDRQG